MCASALIEMNGFAVLSCSKPFLDGTKRQVQIYHLADGTLAGSASLNQSYNSSALVD